MITNLAGQLCQFRDFERDFLLFSNDPADYIQQHWVAGVLYEREELGMVWTTPAAGIAITPATWVSCGDQAGVLGCSGLL